MELRITNYGEPVLRETGKPVQTFDSALKKLAADMIETMYAAEGVGLAAQQVDQAIQLCVVDVSHMDPSELHYTIDGKVPPIDLIMPMALVNPRLQALESPILDGEEGCLSFPGIRGDVPRPEAIAVDYQDLDGAHHHLRAEGWFARVVQHEVDHLNGVLFIDHLETRRKRMLDSKIKRIQRQSRDYLASTAKGK